MRSASLWQRVVVLPVAFTAASLVATYYLKAYSIYWQPFFESGTFDMLTIMVVAGDRASVDRWHLRARALRLQPVAAGSLGLWTASVSSASPVPSCCACIRQRFRAEFAAEMHTVLAEVIQAARQDDHRSRVLWREVWGLLSGAASQQWKALRKELDRMKADTPSVRGSWLAAFLGGLPFFLFALAEYVPVAIRRIFNRTWSVFSILCTALPRHSPVYDVAARTVMHLRVLLE